MVSIIITAYNVEGTLARAIDSALAQGYPHVEVVVVNDCSTDGTSDIIASYGDRIKVVNHEKNMGAGMARRNGIKASTGDFALTLDADDWLDCDLISRMMAVQQEFDAEIVSGGVTVERTEGRWEAHCYGKRVLSDPKERVLSYLQEKVQFMNNKLIARRLLDEVEYCERRFIEDTPTIIPMIFLAERFAYAPTTGYHYLDNPKSLTHTADKFKWNLFSAVATLDIIRFMEAKDYHELDEVLANSFASVANGIQSIAPTPEQVAEYQTEWNYFTTELIKRT